MLISFPFVAQFGDELDFCGIPFNLVAQFGDELDFCGSVQGRTLVKIRTSVFTVVSEKMTGLHVEQPYTVKIYLNADCWSFLLAMGHLHLKRSTRQWSRCSDMISLAGGASRTPIWLGPCSTPTEMNKLHEAGPDEGHS